MLAPEMGLQCLPALPKTGTDSLPRQAPASSPGPSTSYMLICPAQYLPSILLDAGMWHRASQPGVWLPRNLQSVETNTRVSSHKSATKQEHSGQGTHRRKWSRMRRLERHLFKMLLKPMFEASHVKIWDRAIKIVKSVLTHLRHNKSETPDIGDQVSGKSALKGQCNSTAGSG